MASSKNELLSVAMKRTREWVFSLEVPSDVTILIGNASFSLHKFSLVSKSGYIRKLLSKPAEANPASIEIDDLPGGAEAFDYATKFCYGVNFEINVHNLAMLRCAAEALEMTEEFAIGNLVGRTEAYLSEVALNSLSGAISVLIASEKLLPLAENVKLVRRCIGSVAYLACKEAESRWAHDLTRLKIEFFRRVVVAMMARGIKQSSLGQVLMLFAHKTLRFKKIDHREEQEKRLVLEIIVSLLPKERNLLPVGFLSMLIRSSICLDTTIACRIDLEKRMGLQLDQAVVDDLLIAPRSSDGSTLFDVDMVKRIMMNYIEYASEEMELRRVGSLIENYLAEIASDKNLSAADFTGLAELIPKRSRVTWDGLYRAIDIFLKAHPNSSEIEREKLCSIMDCEKLSQEAREHASRNKRLPVETAVQLLYNEGLSDLPLALHRSASIGRLASDGIAVLRRENEEMRMELLKMKMRIQEMESSADNRPPLPRKSLMNSVPKKLGKLIPLARGNGMAPRANARAKLSRDRRHSIS